MGPRSIDKDSGRESREHDGELCRRTCSGVDLEDSAHNNAADISWATGAWLGWSYEQRCLQADSIGSHVSRIT